MEPGPVYMVDAENVRPSDLVVLLLPDGFDLRLRWWRRWRWPVPTLVRQEGEGDAEDVDVFRLELADRL